MRCFYGLLFEMVFLGLCFAAGGEEIPEPEVITIEFDAVEHATASFPLINTVECAWKHKDRIQQAIFCSISQRLAGFNQVETMSGLEQEIIETFCDNPSADTALFLGLCESDESERLLLSSVNHADAAVRNNVKLALARRGHGLYEKEYIERFQEHPISSRLSNDIFDSDAQSIWNALEYIGTPAAIVALYDAIASWPDDPGTEPGLKTAFFPGIALRKRSFLGEVGFTIPDTINNSKDYALWWKEHREQIDNMLKDRAEDIPRQNGTVFVVRFP